MFGKTKRIVNVLAGMLSIQDSILDHLKVIKAELKESNLRLDDIQKNEYLKNQEKAQEEWLKLWNEGPTKMVWDKTPVQEGDKAPDF